MGCEICLPTVVPFSNSTMPLADGIPLRHEPGNAIPHSTDDNSSSTPSPVVFTILPPWLATIGSTARQCEARVRVIGWASGRVRSGLVCLGTRRDCNGLERGKPVASEPGALDTCGSRHPQSLCHSQFESIPRRHHGNAAGEAELHLLPPVCGVCGRSSL